MGLFFFYFISYNMEALFNMVRNINQLTNVNVLFITMSKNPFLKKLITALNTEKQLEFGMLSDGSILPNYSERSQLEFGKANRPIMLKDTGEFWRSFEVILNEDGFEIDGDSVKFDFEPVDLVTIYGEDIYGLTDKNMDLFINALIPKIQNVVIQEILKGH